MSATDLVLELISLLEQFSIPYMLVGSYSSNYYGRPRSTQDADFVVVLDDTKPGDGPRTWKMLLRSFGFKAPGSVLSICEAGPTRTEQPNCLSNFCCPDPPESRETTLIFHRPHSYYLWASTIGYTS